jgi:hypothetical protein
MSAFLRKVYFIEEVIIGALMRLVDERVNEILAEGELSVPPLDVCGLPGGGAVCPDFFLSECERVEKERMLRVDAYSVSISFTVSERDDTEAYCYAYAAAVDRALEENPALNGAVSRAALTGKKYVPPKTPYCGEGWKLVLSIRVTVEGGC